MLPALAIPLAAAAGEPWSVGPPPDWVRPAAVDVSLPAPEGPVRPAVQYLLVDDQVRLRPGGGSERWSRLAWRLVTPEALDDGARLEIDFDPAWERLRLHELAVLRGGARQDRLADAEFALIQREDQLWQGILDGVRTLVVVPADVRVGDVLVASWTLEGDNPVFDGRFAGTWDLGWEVPAARRLLRLIWPTHRALRLRGHGGAPAPAVRRRSDGGAEATWDLRDVPAYPGEDGTPPDVGGWPWVEASEYPDWGAVVDWAVPLYDLPVDPEVDRLARELAPDGLAEEEAWTRLARFVQDRVRYFGVELGPGSHAPRPPGRTLRRRYGDCKDKAVLLVAMARARGIRAWPALVASDGGGALPGRLPSPLAFDHVIVAAELGGRLAFLDPTLRLQGGSAARAWVADHRWALLVRPGEAGLVPVERPEDAEGALEARRRWRLDPEAASARLDLELVATGARADELRAWVADTSPEDLESGFRADHAGLGWEADPLGGLEVSDDREANRLRVAGSWDVRLAPPAEGGAWTLPAPPMLATLPEPPSADRRLPLALPAGWREAEEVGLELPEGWALEVAPAEVEGPGFRLSVARTGAASVRAALEVTADRVAPEELDDYLDALDAAEAALELRARPAPRRAAVGRAALAGAAAALAGLVLAARRRRR